MAKNRFTLQDYYDQLIEIKSMGSMSDIIGMIPGLDNKALAGAQFDERAMGRIEAIILSMTPKERDDPAIIGSSRKKRIASGSGTDIIEINRLLKQFEQMKTMMKTLSKGRLPGFLGGGKAAAFAGIGGGGAARASKKSKKKKKR